MTITGWRFALAGVIGYALAATGLFGRSGAKGDWLKVFKAALLPGTVLMLALVLQTWGLVFTTATKSGFLTCLYVLFVPAVESIVHRRRPPKGILFAGVCALIGVALMCGLFDLLFNVQESTDPRAAFNRGDVLTILCAFAVTAHIFMVGRIDRVLGKNFDSFQFNTAQSLAAGFPVLILAISVEPEAWSYPYRLLSTSLPLIGFTSLCLGSTLIAFALQIRAQKVLSPSLASVLFLLESPFAAIFGGLFLHEPFGTNQILGGAIILMSVAYAAVRGESAHDI